MTTQHSGPGDEGGLHEDHPLAQATAREVMTTQVVTVPGTATVAEAMSTLRAHGVRHLPVTDQDRFVGMVDDRLVAFALLTGTDVDGALGRPVAGLMMRYVPQVGPDTPMPRVANLLRHSRCDAVVVVDERDRLLGLITMVDVVSAVARTGVTT